MILRHLSAAYFVCIAVGAAMNPLSAQVISVSTTPKSHAASPFVIGIEAINAERYYEALMEFRKVIPESPHNVRLLQLTGYAALRAGSPHEAERYLQLALAEKPYNPWPLQVALINTYAAESRWSDFDLLRMQLRRARAASDPLLMHSGGYVAETFSSYGSRFEATEYLALAGPSHIRYRFQIIGADPDAPVELSSGELNGIYFDLEQPAKLQNFNDGNGFSDHLDSDPNFRLMELQRLGDKGSLRTIAVYAKEPSYETVRAQVVAEAYEETQRLKYEPK